MYHLVNTLTNRAGDAMVGYYVRLRSRETGLLATIYADADSTPIENVSGAANAAKTDDTGLYSIYVADGSYDIQIYNKTDINDLLRTIENVPMFSGSSALTSQIGLFTDATGASITAGSEAVETSGYSTPGLGAARFAYDATVDASYVAAKPEGFAFVSGAGRGFRMAEPFVTPEMFGASATASGNDQVYVQRAIDAAVTLGVPLKLLRDYNIWKPASLNRSLRAYLTALGPLSIIGDDALVKPTLNFLSATGGNVDADGTRYNGLWFKREGSTSTTQNWSFRCQNMRWDGNITYTGTHDQYHKPFLAESLTNALIDLDFDTVDVKRWGGEFFYAVGGPSTLAEVLTYPHIPSATLRNVRCEESGLNLLNFGGHTRVEIDGLYMTKGAIAECVFPQGANIRNVYAEDVGGGFITGGNYPDYPLPNIFWGSIERDGSTPLVVLSNFVVRGCTGNLRFGCNVHGDVNVTDCSGELGIFPQGRMSNIKLKVRHTLDQLSDTIGFYLYPMNWWSSEKPYEGDYTGPSSSANASFSGSTMTLNSIVSSTVSTVAGNIVVAQAGHNVAAGTSGGRTALDPSTRIVAQLTGSTGGAGTYTIDPPVSAPIASQAVVIGQLTEPLADVTIDLELSRTPAAVLESRYFYQAFLGAGPVVPGTVRLTATGEGVKLPSSWSYSSDPDEVGCLPLFDEQVAYKTGAIASTQFGQNISVSGSGTIKVIKPRVLLQPGSGTYALSIAKTLGDPITAPNNGNGANTRGYSYGQRVLLCHAGGSGKVTFATDSNQTFRPTIELAANDTLEVMLTEEGGWVPVRSTAKQAPTGLWDYWVEGWSSSISNMFPWGASLIASGTITTAPAAAISKGYNHMGSLVRSSTTANSGARFVLPNPMIYFGVTTLKFRAHWTPATAFTNNTVRAGFLDTTTEADATDGAYFEVNGSGVVSAKTAKAGTRTTSGTTYTLTIDTPYVFDVEVNAAGTSARFRIYAGNSETAVYDQTITTNIPNTTSNLTGSGLVATNSGTTASDICVVHALAQGTVAGFERARG